MKKYCSKILSIFLAAIMLLSVCNILIYAENVSNEVTYYVSADGSDENDGLTAEAPLLSVASAVAKATDLSAGDKINVVAMGTQVDIGTLGDHTATLVLSSNNSSSKTKVFFDKTKTDSLHGPTVFKDVIVTSDQSDRRIYLKGYDVVFESDADISNLGIMGAYSYNTSGNLSGQNLTFNAVLNNQGIYIPNIGQYNGSTYSEDVNVTFNNTSSKVKILHSSNHGGNATYNKNYNLFVNASTFAFDDLGKASMTLNGAMQIIINANTGFSATDKERFDTVGESATGGYYYLKTSNNVIDKISFTDTAGKYTVTDDDITLKAFCDEKNLTVCSENGVLNLPAAGVWEISEYKPAVVRNYYVDSQNGDDDNDGLTLENAVTTVAAAVGKATDLENDSTVVVNLIGDTATMGTLANYVSTLVIQSYSENTNQTALTVTNDKYANGNTVFKNVKLVNQSGNVMYLNGENVTFESDVVLTKSEISSNSYNSTNSSDKTTVAGQTVVFNNAYSGSVIMGNNGHFLNFKFEKDATLEINNSSSAPTIKHSAYYPSSGSAEMYFNANLNYFIRNAASINFGSMASNGVYIITGAVQVLVNSATTVSDSSKTNIDSVGALAGNGYYYLKVDGADNIELTETAGVYKIATDYVATAVNTETLATVESDGSNKLTLTAGEWEVTVGKAAVAQNYYVKNGGTGDGRSAENPAATVDDVVKSINEDGLTSKDTANVYIMQRSDWNTIPAGKIGTNVADEDIGDGIKNGSNTIQPHNMTAWALKGGKISNSHAATIVIKSYDSSNISYLAMSQYLGLNAGIACNGPTVFDNVRLVFTRNTHDTKLTTNHNNVTMTENFKYGYVNCSEYSASHSWDGKVVNLGSIDTEYSIENSNKNSKFTINSPVSTLFVPASYYSSPTINGNMEIEVNTAGSNLNLRWAATHANGCTATFNGDVNINIKNAGTVTNVLGQNGTNKSTAIFNGAFQMIYNSSVNLANKPADLLIENSDGTKKGIVVNGGAWFVKNASGYDGLLKFTGVAGSYSVDERYGVTAVNDTTGEIVTEDEDNILTLSAGDWTVTAEKVPVYKDYYVKNGGTGDGRSAETPAATVYDVIAAVNADLVAGDVANINIMQRDDKDYNSVKNMTTGTVHNFTSWTTSEKGNIPTHAAKIVIKAYDSSVTTYLASNDKYWTQMYFTLNGETEFQDVCLVCCRGNYDGINIGNNDVKFSKDTTFGVLQTDSKVDIAARYRTLNMASTAAGDQKVELDNSFTGNLYINASGYTNGTRDGDVTVVIDNSIDNNCPVIYWGPVHSSSGITYKGNININVKNAYSVKHVLSSSSYGVGRATVQGGVQIITRSSVVKKGSSISEFSDNLTVQGGIWDITLNSDYDDALDFTKTAGKFTVKDGCIATAVAADGTKTFSQDGVLQIAAGEYTVYVSSEFTNNGQQLTVHKDCTIDVSTLEHSDIENKLFVGWKNSATDSYVEKSASYTAGTVLTAVYVDYDEYDDDAKTGDFFFEEAMTTEDGGLRFIFSKNKEFFTSLPNVSEIGAIVLPTDQGGYYEMFLDEGVVKQWTWNKETLHDFTVSVRGKTPSKVSNLNKLEETETTEKYTLCITGITSDKYVTYYNAKGYIKYTDYNGIENVLYTEQAQSCLYKASAEATEKRTVDTQIIASSNTLFAQSKADYLENRVKKDGSGEDGDPYNMYSYNGLNINDIVIDTGIEGFEETDIAFIADPHLNYINQTDISDGLPTVLSSYRGRGWLRDGSPLSPTSRAMNFAASFDKIIMGGDSVDYTSYGGLMLTERLFTQRSVNNNLMMLLGNHEGDELSSADLKMDGLLTVEQRFAFIQTGWSNNVYYASDILKNSAGEEQLMIIGLDNSRSKYWASQIEPLTQDLAYARENGLPVLLFQHIAMQTGNSNETAYKFYNGYDTSFFGREGVSTTNVTRNMCTYARYPGINANNEDSTTVYNLIRANADIIKGVFHGDDHSNMYTEIIGTDANQTIIPQHGIAGIHYNAMMSITLK